MAIYSFGEVSKDSNRICDKHIPPTPEQIKQFELDYYEGGLFEPALNNFAKRYHDMLLDIRSNAKSCRTCLHWNTERCTHCKQEVSIITPTHWFPKP